MSDFVSSLYTMAMIAGPVCWVCCRSKGKTNEDQSSFHFEFQWPSDSLMSNQDVDDSSIGESVWWDGGGSCFENRDGDANATVSKYNYLLTVFFVRLFILVRLRLTFSFSLDMLSAFDPRPGRNPTNATGTGPSGAGAGQLQTEMRRHPSRQPAARQSPATSTAAAATAATAVEEQPNGRLPNQRRSNQLLPVKSTKNNWKKGKEKEISKRKIINWVAVYITNLLGLFSLIFCLS